MSEPLKYGKLSVSEKLTMGPKLLFLPLYLLFNLTFSPLIKRNQSKNWKRVLGDNAFRYITSQFSVPQAQVIFGEEINGIYKKWAVGRKLPVTVDDLGDNAKLMWVGPKRTDRVILFLHGGAFFAPVEDAALSFFRHVQTELASKGAEVGVVVLSYTLIPDATFPTPLRQAVSAIQFLFSEGLLPQHLQLAGDSAGANLTLQVISHILHPLDSVPKLVLSAPFRGALLMSPWTSLTGDTGSHLENDHYDILRAHSLSAWGGDVLAHVPLDQRSYVEVSKAPADWLTGIDGVVDRILITAGSVECLRDDIVLLGEIVRKLHTKTEVLITENGVHDDPLKYIMVDPTNLGDDTPVIVRWFGEGFK